VEAIAVHGRARCDLFAGSADWSVIARVKAAARIPVMGNGDVFDPPAAERMFRETGVDGVMIGRGILSNPWLIRQCYDYLGGRDVYVASIPEKAEFMLSFLRRVAETIPPVVAAGKMKKIGGYLTKGIPGGAQLRAAIHEARTAGEILDIVQAFSLCCREGAQALSEAKSPGA
jgi:tRNA-dihydrouridine synthase